MRRVTSGGGLTSNKLVRPGVKPGPASTNKISPRGVSQFGYATGAEIERAGSYGTRNTALPVNAGTMSQVPLGNAVALNVKGGGPGAGREVHRSGSQSLHGAPVHGSTPPGQPRDILSAFGPEPTDRSPLVERRR
jgi:hypothetical protein